MDVFKALFGVAVIIGLSACSNNAKTTDSVFEKTNATCSGQKIENKFIVQWEDGRITVESAFDAEEFKKNFVEPNLSLIRKVEYDRVITLSDPAQPSADQLTGSDSSWGQQMIQASSLWNQSVTGAGIKVAVVDSGVDVTHPQLSTQIAMNTNEIPNNGVDDDNNGVVDDVYGASFISNPGSNPTMNPHGSHVSGIIAANPNKGSIQGVAPDAKLIPASFITNDGSGNLSDAILAMNYAASRGAKIINASWGGAPCVSSLQQTFANLSSQGILLIVAAGNSGRDLDSRPDYPAAFLLPNQLTIAASTSADFMPNWSNSGFTFVQLAAPGERINSTIPGNQTAYFDGTSMAAPFVSGAAALLWSARPNARADQIKQALLRSVDITPNHEFRVASRGRLNVQKALSELLKLVP